MSPVLVDTSMLCSGINSTVSLIIYLGACPSRVWLQYEGCD